MKKTIKTINLTMATFIVVFLLSSCGGGGTSTNKHLGKLPGIAEKYTKNIEEKEVDLKKCTDMKKAFKLQKEIELLEEEADKTFEEYLTNNPLTNLPFEQIADYKFTISEVSVNTNYSSDISRLQLVMKVIIDQDIKYTTLFAYVNAVDKDGNSLLKRPGVFYTGMRNQDFTKGMEAEFTGSIDYVKNLVKFEKFIFISKEEYNNLK